MRRALLVVGLAAPLLAAVALWATPRVLSGTDRLLACQVCVLHGRDDPWGRPFIAKRTLGHGYSFQTHESAGPNGVFEDWLPSDDVFVGSPPALFPTAAHALGIPPLAVAGLSLVLVASAAIGWRHGPRRGPLLRGDELYRSLLQAAPAWMYAYLCARWLPETWLWRQLPWRLAGHQLVSATWTPLVVWLAGTFVACHLWGRPAADDAQSDTASSG